MLLVDILLMALSLKRRFERGEWRSMLKTQLGVEPALQVTSTNYKTTHISILPQKRIYTMC